MTHTITIGPFSGGRSKSFLTKQEEGMSHKLKLRVVTAVKTKIYLSASRQAARWYCCTYCTVLTKDQNHQHSPRSPTALVTLCHVFLALLNICLCRRLDLESHMMRGWFCIPSDTVGMCMYVGVMFFCVCMYVFVCEIAHV